MVVIIGCFKKTIVSFVRELWLNVRMTIQKTDAIAVLGGSKRDAASALGVSYQAIDKWPETLSNKVADRVLAAWARRNVKNLPGPFRAAKQKPASR